MLSQDPGAVLDYTVDWSKWLTINGGLLDTISASTWTADNGVTIGTSPAPSFTGTTAVAWLSGVVEGKTYAITNRITTAGGRQDSRVFTLLGETGQGSSDRTIFA